MSTLLRKYPRTRHLEGSRLQPGDHDLTAVPWAEVTGRFLVVEEKLDGANAAISFGDSGGLLLQSRGHYLTGGPRERHFDLFKQWATAHQATLRGVLGTRYILYGEWLYAKHTIFYDRLPHYFLEFDVLDRDADQFLGTPERRALLAGLPVASVPVLAAGVAESLPALTRLVGRSHFKSENWSERLRAQAAAVGTPSGRVTAETDLSDRMEGLYLKVEEGGRVVERLKFVRADFLTAVADSGSHWLDRPILPNLLAPEVDLWQG